MGNQCQCVESERENEQVLTPAKNNQQFQLNDEQQQALSNSNKMFIQLSVCEQPQQTPIVTPGKALPGSSRYFENKPVVANDNQSENQNKQSFEKSQHQYEFENGAIYKGEWIGDIREGFGEQVWKDGAKYVGQWKNNKAEGQGTFYHVDGDICTVYQQMKENGKMIKHMEKGNIFMLMEHNMREIGLKTNNMEKELKHGLMEVSIMENIKMDKNKGLENTSGQMEVQYLHNRLFLKDYRKLLILIINKLDQQMIFLIFLAYSLSFSIILI